MKLFTLISSNKSAFVASAGTALMTAGASLPTFAAEPAIPASAAVTTDMLTPLVDGITANIAVILPVGIAIFAIFIGINLIPKLIKRFMH